MKAIIRGLAIATAMTTATSALAAPAMVTTDLNLRTGPGTGYGRITAMPGGSVVDVRGCTRGYSWCRVNWNGYDGWASSHYLAWRSGRPFDNYAASIGIPLIAGAIIGGVIANGFEDHHHRYYYRHHYPRHYYRGHNNRWWWRHRWNGSPAPGEGHGWHH